MALTRAPRKCGKHRTYNPFRIRTYEKFSCKSCRIRTYKKPGGGGYGYEVSRSAKNAKLARYKEGTVSGFDLAGGGVPGHGRAAEIRFVGHVAGQRGVVAENGVFRYRLAVLHALEKFPEVGLFFVPGD